MAEPAKLQERSAELEGLVTEAASRLSVEALLDALCAIYDECSRLDNKNRLPAVQVFINRCACRRCSRRHPGVLHALTVTAAAVCEWTASKMSRLSAAYTRCG